MKTPDYFSHFPNFAFDRSPEGVVTLRLHTDNGPFVFNNTSFMDLVHAFEEVSLDPDNKVLVLTGTGDAFIKTLDFPTLGDMSDGLVWSIVGQKARRLSQAVIGCEVPIVAAINGPIPVHSEIALLSDYVVSTEDAWFQDPHMNNGFAAGDGIQAAWMELIGVNRARPYLMLGHPLPAKVVHEAGAIHELLPRDQVLPRAQTVAAGLAAKPGLSLRNHRLSTTVRLSRVLQEATLSGLPLQGLSVVAGMRR